MPAPSRILRAVSGALALLSVSLSASLIPGLALAQLYSWKDADGNAIIKNYPPPWYKAAERTRGPRVQVLREGKVIDDTAWPPERRQEGLDQAARQTALSSERQAAPSSGLQAAPPAALQAARAAAEQAARQAAEQAARKPGKN